MLRYPLKQAANPKKRRSNRPAKYGLSLLLVIALLICPILASAPALAERDTDFGDAEGEGEFSLSKEYVFRGETFRATAEVTGSLDEDIDFRKVIDIQYEVYAKSGDGHRVSFGNFSDSIGPLTDIKAGTTLSYTLLDAPLAFPGAAPTGNYEVHLEINKIEPEDIWNVVKEQAPEELKMKLGSIMYFDMEFPSIRTTVGSPDRANAGEDFDVNLQVTSPTGVGQVNLTLLTQESGKSARTAATLSLPGSGTITETLTAPMYGGRLRITAEVRSFMVLGHQITLPTPVRTSTTTQIDLVPPVLSLSVNNPATAGDDVDYQITVTNPFPHSLSMPVRILPEWEVPSWADEDLAWFFGTEETIVVPANGEVRESRTAGPIEGIGETHLLKALTTAYTVGGQTIQANPWIAAQALVTTASESAGTLSVSPASVYPGDSFSVVPTLINPDASAIDLDYEIRVYISESRSGLFDTAGVLWEQGSETLPANTTMTLPALDYAAVATSAGKHVGFELVYSGDTAATATTYIRSVLAPTMQIVPSATSASFGEGLTIDVNLENAMDVAAGVRVQVLQRVWNGTSWDVTMLDQEDVTLAANGKGSLNATVNAPASMVNIEYGARVTSVTVAGADFDMNATSWVRVRMKELVPPEITLAVNPNPVRVGGSLEVKTTILNPSSSDMTVPYNIYLRPTSSSAILWKELEVTLSPGESKTTSAYLSVDEAWGDFGSMRVTARIEEIQSGAASIPLSPAIETGRTVQILDLRLRASLRTEVTGFDLSYDAVNNYLEMDKVYMDASIVVTNLGGWKHLPDLSLSLNVVQSEGVQLIDGWSVVNTTTEALSGESFLATARIAINNPTAANVANVKFEVSVSASGPGTGITESFTLGMFRVANGSWRLDGEARLVNQVDGQAFASPLWDSDGDGLSDYEEMMVRGTNPLDAGDPGTVTQAEIDQRTRELKASVNSFISRAGDFLDTIERGGSLLPSGNRAWERIYSDGVQAQRSVEALGAAPLSYAGYAGLQAKVSDLMGQIEAVKGTVRELYGGYAVPPEERTATLASLMELSQEEAMADPDGDGLPTVVELVLGYDPYRWDSQRSGMSDKDYLAASLGGEFAAEGHELLSQYVTTGQLQSVIEDLREAGFDDEQLEFLEQAYQAMRDASWDYVIGLVD